MRTTGALLCFLVFSFPLLGCKKTENGGPGGDSGGVRSKVIKIVSSLPLTGNAKDQTTTIVNAIKMAVEEAGGKVGDFTIEYESLDDATAAAGQWTAEMETQNANQAVSDPDVMVYIGTYNSGAAKISMPILNEARMLMISPANTWPGFTKPGLGDPGEPEIYRNPSGGKQNYCRVVPADDLQGSLAAAWAKEMGLNRVYILDDNEVYGAGVARIFEETAQEIGLEVLGRQHIDPKAQEFRSLMVTIKQSNPDLIYFGGTTQTKGGQIAKDIAAAGLKCKLMCPDGCMEDAFIESAGPENVNGRAFVTFGGFPPEKLEGRAGEFVARYKEKYGAMPQAYAIYGYDAAKAALEAIRVANVKDRAAITEACLAIKDFEGALGTWSFDENGDTTLKTMSGNEVKNGKFEFVKLLGEGQ